MTLGKPGVAGDPPALLNEPCDVATAPNGDIFVADGHSGQNSNATPSTISRIVKFSKDGKFIKTIGKVGVGTSRVQDAARHRVRLARPVVRRRSRKPPAPDPRPGGEVPRRVEAVQPAERHLHRQERRPVWRRLGVEHQEQPGLEARHPHRKREGRQDHGLHPRSRAGRGQVGHERRGRRRGRCRRERLRRRGRPARAEEVHQK